MNTPIVKASFQLNKQEILDNFVNSLLLAGRSKKTIQNYAHTINQLNEVINKSDPANGDSPYSETGIEKFFTYGLVEQNWNKYTVWTKYKNLNPFFKWCQKKGYISSNPLLTLEKPKMPSQPPKALNENEVGRLLNAVENIKYNYVFPKMRNKAIIYLFLYTGIRRKELLDLRMSDIDLENGSIRIEHGKNDKYREIPLEQNILKPILLAYLDYRKKLNKTSQWLFNGTFGNHSNNDNKLTASAIDILFRKLRDVLQFRVTAHRLRHTFATFALDNSGDLYTLKEVMGHEKISTTCLYLHSIRKKKKELISLLSFV